MPQKPTQNGTITGWLSLATDAELVALAAGFAESGTVARVGLANLAGAMQLVVSAEQLRRQTPGTALLVAAPYTAIVADAIAGLDDQELRAVIITHLGHVAGVFGGGCSEPIDRLRDTMLRLLGTEWFQRKQGLLPTIRDS